MGRIVSRGETVSIEVVADPPYTVKDHASNIVGTTLDEGHGLYLTDVIFKGSVIQGKYLGNIGETQANLSEGTAIMNVDGSFTDGYEIYSKAKLVILFNGIIKITLQEEN